MTDFEALYGRYSRDVYRFALYLSGNKAEAEDIAAETFARAWNATDGIRAATAKQYLLAIARNCFLEGLRGKPRETPVEESLPDPSRGPEADAARRMELERVLAALQQMPELDRTTLLLRVQEEMSYQEIADTVGLSLSAVKVRIHRARQRLAEWRASQEKTEWTSRRT